MIEELYEVRNKRSEDNKNKFQLKLDQLRKTEGNQAEIEQSVKDHYNQWNSSWEMMKKRLEEAIHMQNLKIEQIKKAKEEKLRKVEEEQSAKARQEQLLKAAQEEHLKKAQEEQLRKAQEEQLKKAQEEQLSKEEQEWGI